MITPLNPANSCLISLSMETFFQVCYFLILMNVLKQTFPCKYGNVNRGEILSQKEFSFLNISYLLNISENSVSTDTSRLSVDVCKNNNRSFLCGFIRPKQYQHFTVKYGDVGDDTLCVTEHRYIISSMRTWEIKISQLLTRSITAIYLDIQDKTLHKQTLLQIPIDVTYPPRVTSLTVDGQEVNNKYLINEGQKVMVSCSFERGNPPVAFGLFDKNMKKLARDADKNGAGIVRGKGHLNISFSVMCEDVWPKFHCEGRESEQNKSVSFLVRCAPQFVDSPVTLVTSEVEKTKFYVKAYTAAFNECRLSLPLLGATLIAKLRCSLTGDPPDLILRLHLHGNLSQGSWEIILGNEIGSANTTMRIIEESRYSIT